MMIFWGIEVPAKKEIMVTPFDDDFDYVHISQVALGTNPKDKERVTVQVKQVFVDDKGEEIDLTTVPESLGSSLITGPIVIGTLSKGSCDQVSLDLVFDREFKISHNGSGSVFLSGYKTAEVGEEEEDEDDEEEEIDDEEEEEEEEDEDKEKDAHELTDLLSKLVPVACSAEVKRIAKPKVVPSQGKSAAAAKAASAAAHIVKTIPVTGGDDEEDDDDDLMDDSDDDGMGDEFDDLDDEDDEEDDEQLEPTPPKAAKKGANAPAPAKAPVPAKRPLETPPKSTNKTKVSTPAAATSAKKQKTAVPVTPDAKKEKVDAAKSTPAAKTPQSAQKGGTPGKATPEKKFACTPCNKKFTNEAALAQHNKVKHAAT